MIKFKLASHKSYITKNSELRPFVRKGQFYGYRQYQPQDLSINLNQNEWSYENVNKTRIHSKESLKKLMTHNNLTIIYAKSNKKTDIIDF